MLHLHKHGVLSTLSKENEGWPFGSIVPYLVTPQYDVVLYISLISEHFRNLSADPRGSLLIAADLQSANPQAYARATCLITFDRVSEGELSEIREQYEHRFPDAVNYELAHNFVFMRGSISRVRWIGGFGDIRWINGEQLRRVAPDAILSSSDQILTHMNEDHSDALRDYVRAFCKADPKNLPIEMVSITSRYCEVAVGFSDHRIRYRIEFPREVLTPEDARAVLVQLARAARE